jgi:hypothetical protein
MYDWKGQWVEEDEPEPYCQPRCRCGALLSWQPNQVIERRIPKDWTETYNAEGDITSYTILAESVEQVDIWLCKRCNRENEADEAYPR